MERRLLLIATLALSLLGHVAALFLLYDEPARPVSVELVFTRQQKAQPMAAAHPSAGLGPAPSARPTEQPPAKSGWRARWQAKQERYQDDARAQAAQAALLQQPIREEIEAPVLCSEKGEARVAITSAKDISHWGGLAPTGLFSSSYMQGMQLIKRPGPRLGTMEFALPPRTMRIALDEPKNGVAAVGRDGVHCIVGITYSAAIFPITIAGVPVQLAYGGTTQNAVVDVVLGDDGRMKIKPRSGHLDISSAAVYNREKASRRMRTFYSAASLFMKR